MQSNPASTASAAPRRYSSVIRAMSSFGCRPGHRPLGAQPPGRGQRRRPLERALATGPACPIWAEAAAPAAWTASVTRRRPATDAVAEEHAVAVGPTLGGDGQIGHGGHGHARRRPPAGGRPPGRR